MHRRVCMLTTGVAWLVASVANAQVPRGSIGLGVGLQSTILADEGLSVLTPQLYIPIMLTDRLMIEPGIGLLRFSRETATTERSQTLLQLGAGILFTVSPGADGHIYVGPRVGFVRSSSEFEAGGIEEEESQTNLSLAGVLGGEFFLRPRFSLGGEVGFGWLSLDDDDDDASLFNTIAEFRVRWYFP